MYLKKIFLQKINLFDLVTSKKKFNISFFSIIIFKLFSFEIISNKILKKCKNSNVKIITLYKVFRSTFHSFLSYFNFYFKDF